MADENNSHAQGPDPKIMDLHTTVFSQAYSPCGMYLATCNNFGAIGVFNISAALSINATLECRQHINKFQAHQGPIYCLQTMDRFLISGSTDGICGWHWKDIIQSKDPRTAWTLAVLSKNSLDSQETNSVAINTKNNSLLAGCGDNKIHVWDLETGKRKTTFSGHTDYVHSVSFISKTNQCISASEDGSVRFWDYRCPDEQTHIIKPHEQPELTRNDVGKFVSCLAVDEDEDWMVCGGGPALSLWYLKSVSLTSAMETPSSVPLCALFYDDKIITGGTEGSVLHWQRDGTGPSSRFTCSPSSVYSLAVNQNSSKHKVLSIAGTSTSIDVATNFNYSSFSLSFHN